MHIPVHPWLVLVLVVVHSCWALLGGVCGRGAGVGVDSRLLDIVLWLLLILLILQLVFLVWIQAMLLRLLLLRNFNNGD